MPDPQFSPNPGEPFGWEKIYGSTHSVSDIAARQVLYWRLLRPPEQAPDYNFEVISGLQQAGVPETATIVDIGCADEDFLLQWQLTGHTGKLIGIEPNTIQFNGLPYWQLLEPSQGSQERKYALNAGSGRQLPGIDLYEGAADFLPLADGSVDVTVTNFSGYHAFQNQRGLWEVARVLRPAGTGTDRAGIHVDTGSGNENKGYMIGQEQKIARWLTHKLGVEVAPPPPLQAGFTSENVVEVFPRLFRFVYVKLIRQELVLTIDPEAVADAHRTYRPSYSVKSDMLADTFRDQDHEDRLVVGRELFEIALDEVVMRELEEARLQNREVTDQVRRHISFSSNEEIDLPEAYSRISAQ